MASRSLSGDDIRVRPIVAIWISNLITGVKVKIYAMLDTGADWDFVSLKVGRRLALTLSNCDLDIVGINGDEYEGERYLANYQLESLDGSYACDVMGGIVQSVWKR